MRLSLRERATYFLSILFAAAPFVAALIRAVSTRHDLRLLWMAIAASLGAALVMAFGKARQGTRALLLRRAAVSLVIATLLAAATAYLLGATAAAGVWPVAFVLGFCCTASYVLWGLARPRPR